MKQNGSSSCYEWLYDRKRQKERWLMVYYNLPKESIHHTSMCEVMDLCACIKLYDVHGCKNDTMCTICACHLQTHISCGDNAAYVHRVACVFVLL